MTKMSIRTYCKIKPFANIVLFILLLGVQSGLGLRNTSVFEPLYVDEYTPISTVTALTDPADKDDPHRIVGGRPVSMQVAPWQVAVISNRQLVCGGTIISSYWVITAAHCVPGTSSLLVRAGTRYFKSGGQTRRIVLVVRNGDYNANTGAADIAMLRVNRPFIFGRNVRAAQLPSRNANLPRSFVITGWGTAIDGGAFVQRGLRGTTIALVRWRTCVRLYQGRLVVPRRTLCAAYPGRDSCQGDSGGPMTNGNILYGIVAFGDGCALAGSPGVYTDVRYFRSWISRVATRFQNYTGR